jgi:hemoglobin/transferrin/lactoferrin receptor protein
MCRRFFLVVFFLCGSISSWAVDDEPDTLSTIYLNNVVIISAQRYETNTFDRPESVAFLSKAQLRQLSPMSMPEALSHIPGVWMQKTNHGGGSAFVRGLTGYQTLLMVDGIRMNNSTYRSGPNQYLNTIDPLMISNVEVLRGGGSVQYGSDAIGGTIHMLSLDPVFSDGGFKLGGNLYGKYWSADMEKTGRAQLNIGTKNFALAGGLTYKKLGDIKTGRDLGKLDPTGYDEYSMDIKGIYRFGSKHQLIASHQNLTQNEVPLYHKIAPGDYQIYQFNPQQRKLSYLRFESYYNSKLFSELRYTISYQNSLEVREKQKTGSEIFIEEEDEVNTLGANVEIVSNLNTNWKASTGMEFYHDLVNSKARSENLETGEIDYLRGLYPDGATYDNFAIYTLHNYETKRWDFSAGLRYNFIQLHLEDTTFGNTTISPDAFVGNVGVVYKLNENHHLTANINSAFRAPNINDVSSFGIADFRYEVPAYDLKPETSLNKEIGYKVRYDKISGAFHLFHNKLNDLITNVPGQHDGLDSLDGYKVYKRENINEAAIYGGEIELEAVLAKNLIAFGNISYSHGQNISKDEPMRRIPPMNGRVGLRGNFLQHFSFKGEWVWAADQNRLSSGDQADDRIAEGGTAGWNIVNLYGGYEHRYFTLNASLHNLFDEAYRIHGSGIDGIGRSFWLSLLININP